MSEFKISRITKEGVDSIEHMLTPEVAAAIREEQPVTALAVVEDDTAIGALGGLVDGGFFEVTSIFVAPGRRRKGAGKALMKQIFEYAEADGLMVRVEYTPSDEDVKTLEPFLMALDFVRERIIFLVYCVNKLESFKDISRSLGGGMSEIMTFAEAPKKILDKLINNEGDKADEAVTDNMADESSSFCTVEDGEVRACAITEPINDDLVEVSLICSENADFNDVRLMFSYVLDEIRSKFRPDTNILMPVLETGTQDIVEFFSGTQAAVTLGFVKQRFEEI